MSERLTDVSPATTTPEWDFVCGSYRPDEIERSIAESFWRPSALGSRPPRDVRSYEFAVWLCDQYRLAMNKGIQLGKSRDRHSASRVAELEGLLSELGKASIALDGCKMENAYMIKPALDAVLAEARRLAQGTTP